MAKAAKVIELSNEECLNKAQIIGKTVFGNVTAAQVARIYHLVDSNATPQEIESLAAMLLAVNASLRNATFDQVLAVHFSLAVEPDEETDEPLCATAGDISEEIEGAREELAKVFGEIEAHRTENLVAYLVD